MADPKDDDRDDGKELKGVVIITIPSSPTAPFAPDASSPRSDKHPSPPFSAVFTFWRRRTSSTVLPLDEPPLELEPEAEPNPVNPPRNPRMAEAPNELKSRASPNPNPLLLALGGGRARFRLGGRRSRLSRAALALLSVVVLIVALQWFPSGPRELLSQALGRDGRDKGPSLSSPSAIVFPVYSKGPDSQAPEKISRLVSRDSLRYRLRAILDPSLASSLSLSSVSSSSSSSSTSLASNTTVFPVQGDVYPHGLYYTVLRIGDPPRLYFVDIDTGSDLTWLQCDAPCTSCAKGPHPPYRPSRNRLVSRGEDICSHVEFRKDTNSPPGSTSQCDYEVNYADGSSSMGVLVTDSMSFQFSNRSLGKATTVFGCGYDQQGVLAVSPALTDGIIGLSASYTSLPSQWTRQGIITNVVAHCLPYDSKGGHLFLGDSLVPWQSMTWAPLLGRPSEKNYVASLVKLRFGEAPIKASGNSNAKNTMTVFDTGTSYTYFNPELYSAFYAMFIDSLRDSALERDTSDKTLPLCFRGSESFRSIDDVRHLLKPLTLEFSGGGWFSQNKKMEIQPDGYLIISSKGNICLGILDSSSLGVTNLSILGDISLRGNLVVYDNVRDRVGWVKNDCKRLPLNTPLSIK